MPDDSDRELLREIEAAYKLAFDTEPANQNLALFLALHSFDNPHAEAYERLVLKLAQRWAGRRRKGRVLRALGKGDGL